MEEKLKKLFDYQRFENNSRISSIIADTESHLSRELSEEELFLVNAAGEPESINSRELK